MPEAGDLASAVATLRPNMQWFLVNGAAIALEMLDNRPVRLCHARQRRTRETQLQLLAGYRAICSG